MQQVRVGDIVISNQPREDLAKGIPKATPCVFHRKQDGQLVEIPHNTLISKFGATIGPWTLVKVLHPRTRVLHYSVANADPEGLPFLANGGFIGREEFEIIALPEG